MIAAGGHAALWLATAFALLAALGPRLKLDIAMPATILSALFALVALLALVWSVLAADFSLVFVDDRVHRLQPTLVRLAMLTGSAPGLLLLAGTLLAALAVFAKRLAPLAAIALAATLVLTPFARQPIAPPEGRALTIPLDLVAALWQPPLLVLAATLLLAILLHGPLGRPPRWMALAAGVALLLVLAGVAATQFSVETAATMRPGDRLRLQRSEARLVALRPTAGPGYTAIEAEIDVGGETLRPQARTLIHTSREISVPATIRAGLGRIDATLGPARGYAREVRLRWTPL